MRVDMIKIKVIGLSRDKKVFLECEVEWRKLKVSKVFWIPGSGYGRFEPLKLKEAIV